MDKRTKNYIVIFFYTTTCNFITDEDKSKIYKKIRIFWKFKRLWGKNM